MSSNAPENDAGELYAESLRLRKIADLLVEKSELISRGAFSPGHTSTSRIVDINTELDDLGWKQPDE